MPDLTQAKTEKLTIRELHHALEVLALAQGQIGNAVLDLLVKGTPSAEERGELFTKVNNSLVKANEVLATLLATPYGD